jgi:hypothetical protein
MNTGDEIHLTQDNRFMCKEDFLAHTKNLCKNLSGKKYKIFTKKKIFEFFFLKMIMMMILVNLRRYSMVN